MKGKVLFYPNLPKVVCIPIPSENIMNEDELYKHGEKTKQDEKEEYNCRYQYLLTYLTFLCLLLNL